MSHEGAYFHVPRTTLCHMSYVQLQESCVGWAQKTFSMHVGNGNPGVAGHTVHRCHMSHTFVFPNEYCLPSKTAHSPNYCSWLAVCANFYCKITMINRFKLYLIKITVRRKNN